MSRLESGVKCARSEAFVKTGKTPDADITTEGEPMAFAGATGTTKTPA